MPDHIARPCRPARRLRAAASGCAVSPCPSPPPPTSRSTRQAGKPCPNLRDDHRCGIHARLRHKGFTGCTVYDCFGAGQKVSQVTFGGQDWRTGPAQDARRMFDVFPVVRQLHELLWYLTEALTLPAARPVHADLRRALDRTEDLTRGTPEELAALDVRRAPAGGQRAAAEDQRAGAGRAPAAAKKDRRGADLMGARLKGADLRGAEPSRRLPHRRRPDRRRSARRGPDRCRPARRRSHGRRPDRRLLPHPAPAQRGPGQRRAPGCRSQSPAPCTGQRGPEDLRRPPGTAAAALAPARGTCAGPGAAAAPPASA